MAGKNKSNKTANSKERSEFPMDVDVSTQAPASKPVSQGSGPKMGGIVNGQRQPSTQAGSGVSSLAGKAKSPRNSSAGVAQVSERGLRGGDIHDEKKFRRRMKAGTWCVHEMLGAIVCQDVMLPLDGNSERSEASEGEASEREKEPCTICKPYLAHASQAFCANNVGFDAAMRIRNGWCAQNARTTNEAHLRGELEATQRALAQSRDEVRELTNTIVDLRVSVQWNRDEADRGWKKADACEDYSAKLEKDIERLEAERERVDGERQRKRAAPTPVESTRTTPREKGSTTKTSTDDVEMAAAPPAPVIYSWSDLPSLTKRIVDGHEFSAAMALPPPKGTWKMSEDWEFVSTDEYQRAHSYIHKNKCWPVGLAVFRAYYDGRTAAHNNKHISGVQRYAVSIFQMPRWLWDVFTACCMNSALVVENRAFLMQVQQPSISDPVRAAALYIQRSREAPAGCAFADDFGTLRTRTVRGWMLWHAINITLPLDRALTPEERTRSVTIARHLLSIAALPGTYKDVLERDGILILSPINITSWPNTEKDTEFLTDESVVRRLATMGLTIPVVDDLFEFARSYVVDLAAQPHVGWDAEDLKDLLTSSTEIMESRGIPPGLETADGEFLTRTPMSIWPSIRMGMVQERGPYLPDITATPDPGSAVPARITLSAPVVRAPKKMKSEKPKEAPARPNTHSTTHTRSANSARTSQSHPGARTAASNNHAGHHPSAPRAPQAMPASFVQSGVVPNIPQPYTTSVAPSTHAASSTIPVAGLSWNTSANQHFGPLSTSIGLPSAVATPYQQPQFQQQQHAPYPQPQFQQPPVSHFGTVQSMFHTAPSTSASISMAGPSVAPFNNNSEVFAMTDDPRRLLPDFSVMGNHTFDPHSTV
ncbi:hypothetical protein B0H13DRAFT_1872907 [Mycena leptocephala]|nr:hypothetical protein B0H13DRAFT_1872907 [Mycena leptocephala]